MTHVSHWVLALVTTVVVWMPASARADIRYVVFLDLASVTKPDATRWATLVESRVINRLRPGDALSVYPIHDRALAAGELFAATVPALAPDAGMAATAKLARTLIRVRADAKQAVRGALSEGRAAVSQTDLLSALDRYTPDVEGRRVVVLIFSAMLHAQPPPDLNLERTPLTPTTMPDALRSLSRLRQWRSDQMQGALVYCVLNAEQPGQVPGTNDRRVLRALYEAVFSSLGARLLGFDTDLDLRGVGR